MSLITKWSPVVLRPVLVLLLCPPLFGACGQSASINQTIHQKEKDFEVQVSQQMLQQVEHIVVGVKQQAAMLGPICDPLPAPASACTVCYEDKDVTKALTLQTKGCAVTPDQLQQTKDLSITLTLSDLSLSATRTAPNVYALGGSGSLLVHAQLPIFGGYDGVAAYTGSGSINVLDQSVSQLVLDLTYAAGGGQPQNVLHVQAESSQKDGLQGRISGTNLDCKVTGSLSAPQIGC